MATTQTLGKRTRNATQNGDTSAILTRAKRRLVVSGANDENQNPFVRPDDVAGDAENGMDVDEPSNNTKSKTRKTGKTRTVPAKHGKPEQRVALSPSKVNAHFKVGKPAATSQVLKEDKSAKAKEKERSTPKTPRHRDTLPKQVVPVTPRHRVLVTGSRLTTPSRPRTPLTPSQSVYHPVRQLFSRCCALGRLVGREQERDELMAFIDARLDRSSSSTSAGCLYVSGPPGTGKSALVAEISRQYEEREDVSVSTVNCMSVRNAKDLSEKLSEDLDLNEDAGFEYLRTCFVRSQGKDDRKFLVILDEVDHLVDMDLSLLYSLFESSMQKGSRLILIGIANALDLTDRFLPRLKSRGLKPELLPFMPYTAAQIAEVLTSKLKSLCPDDTTMIPFLHPAAIQFCSKKVASQTGDLRKAFDICRRAIDLVDLETREKAQKTQQQQQQSSPSRTPLVENINLSFPPSPAKSPAKQQPAMKYTMTTAPKATIAHVAKVTAQVFSNGTTQRLSTLNLQQKAVLCALCSLEAKLKCEADQMQSQQRMMPSTPSASRQAKASATTAPTIKSLYEAYTMLCTRDNLFHPLSSIEFRDVVAGLEALSLIAPSDGSSSFGPSLSSSTRRFVGMPMTPSRTLGRPRKNGFGGAGVIAVGDERRVSGAFGGLGELKGVLEGPGGELLREMLEV